MNPYEDIIGLEHHVSATRPRMPMADRAAQFSPFAALTGYDDAIRETARFTDTRSEPGEEALAELDMKLRLAAEHAGERRLLTFTCFKPDGRKFGGEYVTVSGEVKRVDMLERLIVLQSGEKLPMDDVLDIDGELY